MNKKIDSEIIDIFCELYGDPYREALNSDTSMADIPEWDSLSFLDFVVALEDKFNVEFTDEEATQMFQLGHIQRLVDAAKLDIPHEDEAHACCLIYNLNNSSDDDFNVIVLSGSSTREGLLRGHEAESELKKTFGPNAIWYNASVSGLVAAETLQLLEQTGTNWNGAVVIGTSPIIYAGCGVTEFERSIQMSRFPFSSVNMNKILTDAGYSIEGKDVNPSITLDKWVERYLKGRDLNTLHYEPYIYPTLPPWGEEKYDDIESVLRFYNSSVLNFEQSSSINAKFYEAFADWSEKTGTPLVLCELTLHSKIVDYLEKLGGIVTDYKEFISDFSSRRKVPIIDIPAIAGIQDNDFRDPAHVHAGRDKLTIALLNGLKDAIA